MQRRACRLAFVTQNPCIDTLVTKCITLNHIKQLQASLYTLGLVHNQYYTFRLIRFCILNLFNISYATSIFKQVNKPNVYLYSAMINAFALQNDHLQVVGLYKDMVFKGKPRPNHFIYPNVLKSSSQCGFGSYGGKMVHTQIVKTGFGSNPIVQTALVDLYTKYCCDVGVARQVFDEMSERNVVSWTAMISGYVRGGDVGTAILLFERMNERDVPCWNAVIAGCIQNGFFPEAITFLRRMLVTDGVKVCPNQVTLACALSACGHTGLLQLGQEIHGYVYRNGIGSGSDSYLSTALVDFYGKCGCLKEAERVFRASTCRNLTSWNTMINCLALHGQSEGALGVFEELVQGGEDNVKPDKITFTHLLNACTHGGLVDEGYYYFDVMTKVYSIQPQIEHYGCIVDLLGRAGRFQEAMDIINSMRVEADEVIWGSLLNGCKIHGNANLAEFSLKKLIDIDPNNGGYISMLANLYGELEKWDDVSSVRKILKEQKARKVPGCSWIELDCEIHQFYSCDYAHPRVDEMYSALESLSDYIRQRLLGCVYDENEISNY